MMLATFIALMIAHVAADFVLQTRHMVAHKQERRVFAGHIAIVGLTAVIALLPTSIEGWAVVLLATGGHGLIDAFKQFGAPRAWLDRDPLRPLQLFLADQAAHIGLLAAAAALGTATFAHGGWPRLLAADHVVWLLCAGATAAGFILATRASGFAMTLFMRRFKMPSNASDPESAAGLPDGGIWIGYLERALIFLLVLSRQFEAIGLLIAAKSVLRFQYAAVRQQSELVIIGSLASFGAAIAIAQLTHLVITTL